MRRGVQSIWRVLSSAVGAGCALSLCAVVCAAEARASSDAQGSVVCRPELGEARRREMAERLRAITGWRELEFDARGALRTGRAHEGGSAAARALLSAASAGRELIVIEDASGREDVVFCRVAPGRWARGGEERPPAQVVLVDFTDFAHVRGDRAALSAFNVGWAVLHEIAHAVHDSEDSERPGEVGECEELINLMRRECGLAERAEYFFTPLPGTWHGEFRPRLVRLAFEHRTEGSNKRYWLVWDASLVGGLGRAAR